MEITLKRGVWVEGKVVNRADGRPVKAVVQYYPLRDNPHLKECPDAAFLNNNISDEPDFPTDAEGRFRALALPGGGLLSVRTNEPGFLTAEPLAPQVAGNVLHPTDSVHNMQQFQALVPINPPDGERFVIPDIKVAPGRKQHLKMTGPDGQPVTGVKLLSLQRPGDRVLADALAPGSELTFIHSDPGKAETIVLLQADRSLAAVVELKGDEPDPIQVDLRPAGTVIGRLVDEEGRPRPNIELGLTYQTQFSWPIDGQPGLASSRDRPRRPVPDQEPRAGTCLRRSGQEEGRAELLLPHRRVSEQELVDRQVRARSRIGVTFRSRAIGLDGGGSRRDRERGRSSRIRESRRGVEALYHGD